MISIKSAGTRLLATLAVGAAAGATLLVPSTAHAASTSTMAVSPVLKSGQYLKPGQYRRSPNGVYTLIMQTDGNLVVYTAAKKPLWSSKTVRHGAVLQMRNDGRLVIVYGRTAIWSTSAH